MPPLDERRFETCLWDLVARMMLLILERAVLKKWCGPKSNGSVFIQESVGTVTIFKEVQLGKIGEIETEAETVTEIEIEAEKERDGMEPYLRGYPFTQHSVIISSNKGGNLISQKLPS